MKKISKFSIKTGSDPILHQLRLTHLTPALALSEREWFCGQTDLDNATFPSLSWSWRSPAQKGLRGRDRLHAEPFCKGEIVPILEGPGGRGPVHSRLGEPSEGRISAL